MIRAEDVLAAARAFVTAGAPRRAEPLGSGHIHHTFSVSCRGGSGELRYVLQRLNERVFPEPHAVVENVVLITRALAESRADAGPDADAGRRCLRCLETRAGGFAHVDAQGGVWRGFPRIEGARTWDSVQSPEQAERAARAFGEFAARLTGLDPSSLHVTIPGFHDFTARARALEQAIASDRAGRSAAARADVDAMRESVGALSRLLPPARLAELPERVVHNDCKLNNVLFDEESGEALCVIDLDTVMPGTLLADFGDLVRTAACREPEDSRELERVRGEPDLYRALARGYLAGIGEAITPGERELLPLAGPSIALETGVRFLTDHLNGDRYFRVARPEHNLDRARTQLRLAQGLLEDLDTARRYLAEAESDRQASAAAGK